MLLFFLQLVPDSAQKSCFPSKFNVANNAQLFKPQTEGTITNTLLTQI